MKPIHAMLRQRGLSLLELMISITIGLALLAGLATVFSNMSSNQAELTRSSQQIENGRFASTLVQQDISHAGYFGRYVAYATVGASATLALPDACSTNFNMGVASPTPLQKSLPFAVTGYNNPVVATWPATLTCVNTNDHQPDTDILVVRRADSKVAPSPLVNNTIYIQTVAEPLSLATLQPIIPVIAQGSTPGAFNLVGGPASQPGEIRRFRVQIYFVSKCSVPAGADCGAAGADNGTPIPTLKRMELSENGTFQVVSLVEGIEQFQVEYGIDAVPGGLTASQPYAGDGMPDSWTDNPGTLDFTQVTAIRFYLLARSTEPSPGYTDTKKYNLGTYNAAYEPIGATEKRYKRHLFTSTVRLQNVAGWREQ